MTNYGKVNPLDDDNEILIDNVHPKDWVNPTPEGKYNLVIIGAGTAGLVTAIGAAGLGARVALIERHLMGGDCLNVGCVPSKALIKSARIAADINKAEKFGIKINSSEVDFAEVMKRMRHLRAQISPNDAARRYRELGIDVFLGEGKFKSPTTIEVDNKLLVFKKAVIATGARAIVPDIEGMESADYLTNENVFDLTERPGRLAVVGAGPIGSELAQTFQRLGCQVTLFHKHGHILDREDSDAAEIVQKVLRKEGIELVFNTAIKKVEKVNKEKNLVYITPEGEKQVTVDELLIGVGRQPNIEGLDLEKVGIQVDKRRGIKINDQMQTSSKNIYAVGDVCMNWKFTHAADAAAKIVIQNALFGSKKKPSSLNMSWATYTDPEIAHIGFYREEAQARGVEVDTYIRQLAEVDRAILDSEEDGFVKIHVKKGTDKIIGATIVARHAGDLISEVAVAMAGKIGLGKLYYVIHPYPTQAEAIKQTAGQYMRTRLTPLIKKVFGLWLKWSRR